MLERAAGTDRRKELGRFLRAMRERVQPSRHGISIGTRRRGSGLLREEVALLAGISATWYTWLEQGREANPSAQVLNALADVLKLLPVEREHLFKLAKPEWLPETSPSEGSSPDPWIADLLTALSPNPAYVLNRAWDFAAWNDEAAALFGGFDPEDPVKRNLLTRLFLDPGWRALFADWEVVARSAIAQFRAATVGYAAAADIRAVLDPLRTLSPEFDRQWAEMRVEEAPIWSKRLVGPNGEVVIYDYFMLTPAGVGKGMTVSLYRKRGESLRARPSPRLSP
ncbi:helix-turn-helix transcriptional regulator [Mesorhizobium dulcispinae]|uniref:helix-turn-helix transcriptional regulator n=1 Tax=Mesorhizobium dulcispinae TaxID=3072316 RepID=UPI002A243FAB|nr:helix-turn-helix transcriptional regulator [Mesorhizobium sp. VK23D]MDX8517386.1 helix-turn-helix transcriptional regulator [Mesorhizobium sp. VK23D]